MTDSSLSQAIIHNASLILTESGVKISSSIRNELQEMLPENINIGHVVRYVTQDINGKKNGLSAEDTFKIRTFLGECDNRDDITKKARSLYATIFAEAEFMTGLAAQLAKNISELDTFFIDWEPNETLVREYIIGLDGIAEYSDITQSISDIKSAIHTATKQATSLNTQESEFNLSDKIHDAITAAFKESPTESKILADRLTKSLEELGHGALQIDIIYSCFDEEFYQYEDETLSSQERGNARAIIDQTPTIRKQLQAVHELRYLELALSRAFVTTQLFHDSNSTASAKIIANTTTSTRDARDNLQQAYIKHGVAEGEQSARKLVRDYEATIRTAIEQELGATSITH